MIIHVTRIIQKLNCKLPLSHTKSNVKQSEHNTF